MSVAERATELAELLRAGMEPAQLFLRLYGFIDNLPNGRFGWFSLGPSAVHGVECDSKIRDFSGVARQCIVDDTQLPDAIAFSGLGAVLDSIVVDGVVTDQHSRDLVIALRVLDSAFRGIHSADSPVGFDSDAVLNLRTNLRLGLPLLAWGDLQAYPKPQRVQQPEIRGQSSLNELLDILTVISVSPHLQISYKVQFAHAAPGADGFKRVGIIPTVFEAHELLWTKGANSTYRVQEHVDHEAGIRRRVLGALGELVARNADLVLIPELVSGPKLLSAISEYLNARAVVGRWNPCLLLAGTMLVNATDGTKRNRAVVLNGTGSQAWIQDKLHAYCFTAGEQARCGFPLGDAGVVDCHEEISVEPRSVAITDISPSQRVVVLTCEDFIQVFPHRPLLIELGVTTVLVPIMAGGRAAPPAEGWVSEGAMQFVRHPGSASVMANSGTLVGPPAEYSHWWNFSEIRASPRVTIRWEEIRVDGEIQGWLAHLDRPV